MRLIDADRLKEKMATTLEVLKHIFPPGEQEVHLISAFATVGEMADDCPTIDAVPVVRCKDCKWWTKQEASLQGRCDAYSMYPTGEWYCARGERKDDDCRKTND